MLNSPNSERVLLAVAVVSLAAAVWATGRDRSSAPAEPKTVEPTESFSQLDANRDGVLEPREARNSEVLRGRFADADANRDGSIDRSEFAAYELLRQNGPEETSPAEGGASADQPGNGEAAPTGDDTEAAEPSAVLEWENPEEGVGFQRLDRNGDDLITQQEAESHPRLGDGFGEADTDLDGTVDRGEFAAFELEQTVQPPETPGLRGEPIIEQPPPEE